MKSLSRRYSSDWPDSFCCYLWSQTAFDFTYTGKLCLTVSSAITQHIRRCVCSLVCLCVFIGSHCMPCQLMRQKFVDTFGFLLWSIFSRNRRSHWLFGPAKKVLEVNRNIVGWVSELYIYISCQSRSPLLHLVALPCFSADFILFSEVISLNQTVWAEDLCLRFWRTHFWLNDIVIKSAVSRGNFRVDFCKKQTFKHLTSYIFLAAIRNWYGYDKTYKNIFVFRIYHHKVIKEPEGKQMIGRSDIK